MQAAPAQPARSRPWLHGLLCGALVVLAAPVAMLAAVLGLPALLAWLLGGAQSRPLARTLGLAATAATLPALAALWRAGIGWSACLDLLAAPRRLAFAWALQAGFWLIGELAPLAIRLALDAAAAREAARLSARRAAFEEDWGLPPAAPDPP
jgi:hypothetical protein